LYAITAAIICLYAALHTLGALILPPSFSTAADGVRSSMESVRFACAGSHCTWFGFYLGFGYMVSLFLILAAVVTFYLGRLDLETRKRLRPVTFALALSFIAMSVLCGLFFFVQPLIFSATIAILLLIATFGWT
jgi:hypothetical protein